MSDDKRPAGKRHATQRPKANTDINAILIQETREDLLEMKINNTEVLTSVRFINEKLATLEQSRNDQGRRLGALETGQAENTKLAHKIWGFILAGAVSGGATGAAIAKLLGG